MGNRASQLHKLNVRGETSDFQFAASLKSLVQHGTEVINATIEVNGFGNIGDVLNATTDVGAGSVAHSYTVVAAEEAPGVMAIGLAADINADIDHTAVAVHNIVQILKTTAGTVRVVSTSIS